MKWVKREGFCAFWPMSILASWWINRELVEEGWAWHYRPRNRDWKLEAAERDAQDGNARTLGRTTAAARSLGLPKIRPPRPGSADPSKVIVYVAKSGNGMKYHDEDCRQLKKGKKSMSLSEAKEEHFTPCRVCKPPRGSEGQGRRPMTRADEARTTLGEARKGPGRRQRGAPQRATRT